MYFNKFNQSAVGILNIGEMPGGQPHVKVASVGTAVHSEGVSVPVAMLFHSAHIDHIHAELDKSRIAPLAWFLKDLTRGAIHRLYQLDGAAAV